MKKVFNTPEHWVKMEINIADYNEIELEEIISGYYKDLNEVKNIYGDDWAWIVAECAFELKNGNY